ncbi:MAG: hypothetical protein C5B50_03220 [Verrucomicrobia bacterium]|nr:MAG: hypothetical protein C5B50_03220 [Verrucomicrobiota bacterium]
MKRAELLAVVALAGMVVLSGCGKSNSQQLSAPIVRNGISVDVPKLETTFASASPSLRDSASKIQVAFRYENYKEALAELDKLAADPSLTPEQKKLVGDVTEEMKQAAAAVPPKGQ